MVRNAYLGIGTEYETLLKAFDKGNEISRNVWGKIAQWPPTAPEWCVSFPNIEEKTENCRRKNKKIARKFAGKKKNAYFCTRDPRIAQVVKW